MATEQSIQNAVHALEIGKLSLWMKRFLIIAAIIGLGMLYLTYQFRGLATSQAMDQAQIGRELLRGNGWSTKFIRPLAIGGLERHDKEVKQGIFVDTYNAPLPPLVDAAALALPAMSSWQMTPTDFLEGDLAITLLSMLLFVCAIGVLYLIALELFDQQLALLGCGLVLVCNTLWQYTLSGLPQMLILLLFHLTIYSLIRAKKAQFLGGNFQWWLAAGGAGFGLLALSHALTIWMLLPALAFTILWFKTYRWSAVILLGMFLVVYAPWLVRNFLVCGNPWGLAFQSLWEGVGFAAGSHMRLVDHVEVITPHLLIRSFQSNLVSQFNRLFEYFGWSIVVPVAFVSLMHPFKRPLTASLRWLLLAMWAGAVAGMATFGVSEEQGFAANQFHLLFVPLFTCYGLAYLLILWDRRVGLAFVSPHWNKSLHTLLRRIWLTFLFVLCGLPMIFTFLFPSTFWPIRWPPYLPQYIAVFHDWMKPEEIIASDMPWAVAWYADRRSIWLPKTMREFTWLNDYKVLGAPVNGIYLTPVSGSRNTMEDIYECEYKDWALIILRQFSPKTIPLHWAIVHGSKECLFISDRDRRLEKAEQ